MQDNYDQLIKNNLFHNLFIINAFVNVYIRKCDKLYN